MLGGRKMAYGTVFLCRITQLVHMHKIILRLQDKSAIIGNSKTLLVRMWLEKGVERAFKKSVQKQAKKLSE